LWFQASLGKQFERPYQGVDPEFKPQYCNKQTNKQKKKKEEEKG
jgi:hypothetical protein